MSINARPRKSRALRLAMVPMMIMATTQSAWAQFDDEEFPPPPPPIDGSVAPQPFRPGVPSGNSNFNNGGKPSGPSTNLANVQSKGTSTKKETLSAAGIEDITNENFPETIESFDFPNAEIADIVKAISELTGKNFIVDPGVRGKITIIAPSKITVAEAYKAFLSALAINGFAVVPSGKFLKVRSARNAQRDGIETYSGNYYPNADQMITRIVHLKHISAEMVNRDLRILTSKDGELSPYTATNSLIISDYGSNIERIMKILNQLDVPGFEDQLEVVPVRFAKSKDIADLVMKIVNKGDSKAATGGGFSAGVPRFSAPVSSNPQSKGSAYFMVFPDDRTNSLIVVGNHAGIARVRKLVSQLDFRIHPDESGGVHVYYLKFGDAEKISATLSGIAKDAGPKPSTGSSPGMPPQITSQGVQTPTEVFGGDVKITADKGTNSLVVVASKQDYEVVLNLLSKLDIPSDQVYVEAVIMEMAVVDTLDWKVGFYQYADNGDGTTTGLHSGFGGFSSADLTSLMSPTGGQGAILGFGSGQRLTVNQIGSSTGTTGTTATTGIQIPSLVSFINFLKTNAHGNVLSTPQVLALNNQESTIEVGDKVITSTSQTVNTGVTTITPTLEDAKIKLKIKPFISPASNSIRMEVENSVSQLSNAQVPPKFADQVQPLATRLIKTNIVVPNGDTAVLGGLMKEQETENITKVPLLGDIPIIGWLFKSRSTVKNKTNLVVFLTPKIIRSPTDAKDILNKKVDERLGFIKELGGRDPYGAKVDELQGIHAAAPAKETEKK